MRVINNVLRLAAVLAVAASMCKVANAQLDTFAEFDVINPNVNPIRMINTGSGTSRLGTYTAGGAVTSLLVNFTYKVTNGLLPQDTVVTGRLTFTSAVTTTVVVGGGQTIQEFRDIRLQFVVEDSDFPALAGTNLLTVSSVAETGMAPLNPLDPDPGINGTNGTTGSMVGGTGGTIASVQASESTGGGLNYIGYSSDYLDFNQTFDARSFQLGLSAITPTNLPANGYRRGPNPAGNPDSLEYARSFQATLTGSFDSDPLPGLDVPEPTSLALFLPIMAFAGWGIRKRRQ